MRLGGNRFDRSELAGAFGDLGTLVPFVVGYITIARPCSGCFLCRCSAGVALWNMGVAYLAGLLLHHAAQ